MTVTNPLAMLSPDEISAAGAVVRADARFPEGARFVHVVRDGRDASASRVAQARWLVYPRTRRQGIEWWEQRMRRAGSLDGIPGGPIA